jgi:hypothetical protein
MNCACFYVVDYKEFLFTIRAWCKKKRHALEALNNAVRYEQACQNVSTMGSWASASSA